MAFTQTDLSNIDAAIATGELSVEVNGRKVIYRSIDQLKSARALIAEVISADAAKAAGTQRTSYRFRFASYRGN